MLTILLSCMLPCIPGLMQPSSSLETGDADRTLSRLLGVLGDGQTEEAIATIRDLESRHPDDPATIRWTEMRERLGRPCVDPDTSALRRVLPGEFELCRSDHILLWHQGTTEAALKRVAVLERVVVAYTLLFTALGFDLAVPEQRLVSVWFAQRRDYLAFLRSEGAGAFLDTTGYFHPTRQIVVTFELAGAVGSMPWSGLDPRAVELGTATHEVVHQLTLASGLASRPGDLPHWLHEGLAAQFEVAPEGCWAGVGARHDIRLADWRRATEIHRLVPLIRDEGLDHGYHRTRYAEAWSLVWFLRQRHSREFVAYLDLLRIPRADIASFPDHFEDAFRLAFGADLTALEAEWVRSIDEQARPRRRAAATLEDDTRALPLSRVAVRSTSLLP